MTDTGESTASINRRADDSRWPLILPILQAGGTLVRPARLRDFYTDDGKHMGRYRLSAARVRKLEREGVLRLRATGLPGLLPDWHAVALQLPRITSVPADRLPPPRLDDYAVTSYRRLVWCPPTIVCTFADGETVRMSFASIVDRPLNIGRGLRLAITAYRFRVAVRRFGRSNLAWKQRLVAVPEIVACAVERDDVEVARYDLDLVNRETSKWRQAIPALTDQRGPPP